MDKYPLQDRFLTALRQERVLVSIHLLNGLNLRGEIESFDQFALLLKSPASQLVYKRHICTIMPLRVARIQVKPRRQPPP